MYKIDHVKIIGFWHRFDAQCTFLDDTNIIVGKNGSGKTTFMNILNSVLNVDIEGIDTNDFESIEIKLSSGSKSRTVRAKKIDDERLPFQILEYQISKKKYPVRIIAAEQRRMSMGLRRRALEESEEVREALSALVSVSSLSVYRLRRDDEYEVRDRHGSRVIMSPVDFRLSEAIKILTQYQLELSQNARVIATNLQKEVLASILYSDKDSEQKQLKLEFDRATEKQNLVAAYTQLNAIDSNIKKRIDFHVSAVDKTVEGLQKIRDSKGGSSAEHPDIDFGSIEALRQTRKVIDLSLKAEEKTDSLFAQINLFLRTVRSFVSDKQFSFESGVLKVSNSQGIIDHSNLSSGEKQLLILLIEALLQKQKPHIFLADEPELSLHIEWQRMIIPAIRNLNPNAQVIAATHSPEVASRYKGAIFDMEALIDGNS